MIVINVALFSLSEQMSNCGFLSFHTLSTFVECRTDKRRCNWLGFRVILQTARDTATFFQLPKKR